MWSGGRSARRSRCGARQPFSSRCRAWKASISNVDVHDVLATDEHVVGLVTATVRVGDDEFSYRTAEISHVVEGKVVERWAFSDDTQAIVDFFARFG